MFHNLLWRRSFIRQTLRSIDRKWTVVICNYTTYFHFWPSIKLPYSLDASTSSLLSRSTLTHTTLSAYFANIVPTVTFEQLETLLVPKSSRTSPSEDDQPHLLRTHIRHQDGPLLGAFLQEVTYNLPEIIYVLVCVLRFSRVDELSESFIERKHSPVSSEANAQSTTSFNSKRY